MQLKIKLFFILPLTILAITLVVIGSIFFLQPAPLSSEEEHRLISLPEATPDTTLLDTIWERYYGKQFTFLFPASATVGNPYKQYESTPAAEIESAGFSYGKTIFANVTLFQNESINQIPEIVYRRLHPEEYHEETLKIASISGVEFKTADNKEQLGFLPIKGKIVAIGITGDDTQSMTVTFNQLIHSFSLY